MGNVMGNALGDGIISKMKGLMGFDVMRMRRLQPNPLFPNYRPGESTFLDTYCRYGCTIDALTAPNFYRPFFGYGYPMIGNEYMFPAGYGGNANTELGPIKQPDTMQMVNDVIQQQNGGEPSEYDEYRR